MLETTSKERNMERVSSTGQMAVYTKASLPTTTSKALGRTSGLTGEFTPAHGSTTGCMGRESSLGQMGVDTRATT
jgi:hypothetical protein